MKRVTKRVPISATFLVVISVLLAACGGGGNPSPAMPASGNQRDNNPPPNTTQKSAPAPTVPGQFFSGTISQYDAGTKTLVLKGSDSSAHTFNTADARIMKDEQLSKNELQPLLGTSGLVAIVGQKGSDSSYIAQSVIVMVGSNPGGALPSDAPPNGGQSDGTRGQANSGILLQGATMSNSTLTGKDIGGQPVIVHLSDNTVLLKQTPGMVSDLQPGQQAMVSEPSDQAHGGNGALLIVVGALPPVS